MRGRRGAAVNLHCDHLDTAVNLDDHLDTAFLDARPLVRDVVDADALFWVAGAWDATWADMLHCWCGCPL